ncbi:hypothetical protein SPOG_03649 [Schizosaccharomyces cryophilus OY26]|uniref:Uncharacterized protein n=1 Tax=Schizosaccharomyces cryophilus (strain OY26 / ATCC MYA-4695 / CBS 11777 / NBRC 106824 / NRRL Y48691) TaxID=653667 RepID=S9W3I7_SCHCR|nr:uncharacterized protein SPOG_03649 [Schizosaccharomyces cryophilus OY26]EPY53109.1 hypothetical protein SPOG_03649 [Schizosaccharomyces cryophilus OY26]
MLLPKKSTILLLLLYYLAIQCSISRAIPSRSYWKTNQHNEGTNSPSDKPDFSYQPNTEQEANNFLQPRNFNEDLKINADGINIPKDVTKTYTVIVYTPTSQTPETVIVYTPTNSNQRTVIVYSPSSSPTGGSSKPPNETPTWTSSASSAAATIITTPNVKPPLRYQTSTQAQLILFQQCQLPQMALLY